MPTLVGKLATTRYGAITPPNEGDVVLALSGYSALITCGTKVELEPVDRYGLYALGYAEYDTKGFFGELSGYSLIIWGGGQGTWTLPKLTMSASGTAAQLGSATLALSGYSSTITGTTDAYGRLQQALPKLTLVARSGGQVIVTGPTLVYSGSGKTDALGQLTKTLPNLRLVASGTVDNYGSVVGTLPGLEIAPSGVMRGGLLPRATILIVGGQALAVYEAYNFTILSDSKGKETAQTTHYTNYPFDRIVRFGNTYYGVAATGLFALTGDTFDGTPIVSVVETAPTDFGARELKRPFSLYMGGRVGADFRATVVSAEIGRNSYNYRPMDKTGARNYRVFLGKGIRARYLAYAFTNIDGGDFELDDITPEVAVQRRTA
jgi:hypothetical protein